MVPFKAISLTEKEKKEILYILQKTGAYLKEGHYKLASGKHSDRYVHVRLALSYEEYAKNFGQAIAEFFRIDEINVVAGFTVGGILLAKSISELLNATLVVGEKKRKEKRSEVVFSNLDEIRERDNILLVDDVLTTGGSMKLAINAINRLGRGVIKGVAIVVDRSKGKVDFGIKTVRLVSIDLSQYNSDACPLCRKGLPLKDLSAAETDISMTLSSLPEENQRVMAKAFRDVEEILRNKSKLPKKG